MRRQPLILPFFLLVILLGGCQSDPQPLLPQSSGAQGEVLVVTPTREWNQYVKELITDCLKKPVIGLPRAEPMFDVVHVDPSHFNSTLKRHHKILILRSEDSLSSSSIHRYQNKWSSKQLIWLAKGPRLHAAAQKVQEECPIVLKHLVENDLNLSRPKASAQENAHFKQRGGTIQLPSDYKVARIEDDFLWFRKATNRPSRGMNHPVQLNVIWYRAPLLSEQFTIADFITARNRVVGKFIKGADSTTYMQTSTKVISPVHTSTRLLKGNIPAKEIAGLWEMNGVFMGGPFVSVVIPCSQGKGMDIIEGFCYAPEFPKRELVRSLTAILHTFSPQAATNN